MNEQQITFSGAARATGLSRQTLYKFVQPEFDPFTRSFRAFARLLGCRPENLLNNANTQDKEVKALLDQAIKGDARAFELLPAQLTTSSPTSQTIQQATPLEHLLLRAAAHVAAQWPNTPAHIHNMLKQFTPLPTSSQAFFFGADLMPIERIIAMTPSLLRAHLVFGAFNLSDFKRHFDNATV